MQGKSRCGATGPVIDGDASAATSFEHETHQLPDSPALTRRRRERPRGDETPRTISARRRMRTHHDESRSGERQSRPRQIAVVPPDRAVETPSRTQLEWEADQLEGYAAEE